jgi:hypothetical protein
VHSRVPAMLVHWVFWLMSSLPGSSSDCIVEMAF